MGGGAAKSPLGYNFFLTEIRLLFIHPDLPPFLKEGWGGFFIKIKIPLASPFIKGRNYLNPPVSSFEKGGGGRGIYKRGTTSPLSPPERRGCKGGKNGRGDAGKG